MMFVRWYFLRRYPKSSLQALTVSALSYSRKRISHDPVVASLADTGKFGTEPARRAYHSRQFILAFQNSIQAPERCPFPVIAAVHGPVFGLGMDIITACDVRYASSCATFSIKVHTAALYFIDVYTHT